MDNIQIQSLELVDNFSKCTSIHERRVLLKEFLKTVNGFPLSQFPQECEWLQTSRTLTPKDLSGKVVLLDFFTYCCINCMHMLPFLHSLESKHSVADGFAVIGIHSAKFPNEKSSWNIEKALKRYSITHPVLNDNNLEMWNSLNISCWPTLAVVNPHGKIVLCLPGETYNDLFELFIDESLQHYSAENLLSPHALPLGATKSDGGGDKIPKSLKFPGKVAVDKGGNRLAVSDTGNHRILLCSMNGEVNQVVGSSVAGWKDGEFEKAQFNSPQGVAWSSSNSLYVADCDNHCIRKIDLIVRRVVTVAGTGAQGNDLEGGKEGVEQVLSSPWDVQIGGSPGFPLEERILYIAMSGIHQIWALFLQLADWQKGAEHTMGTCIRFVGSGKEENGNNSYPHKAGLAQPSGLAIDPATGQLFVADSESSTIRKVNLKDGSVQAVVGGHFDPTNLFAFGDVDGKARDVKLQHPLGVAWDSKRSKLYVADSYNHKIKVVDPGKKTCNTLCGPEPTNLPEHLQPLYPAGFDAVDFNEPGGVCLDAASDVLYVADTNNHRIMTINLLDGGFSELKMQISEARRGYDQIDSVPTRPSVFKPLVSRSRALQRKIDSVTAAANQKLRIGFKVHDVHLTDSAPSAWQISAHVDDNPAAKSVSDPFRLNSGTFSGNQPQFDVTIPLRHLASSYVLAVPDASVPQRAVVNIVLEAILYYCLKDSDVCTMKSIYCVLPVTVLSHGDAGDVAVDVNFNAEDFRI